MDSYVISNEQLSARLTSYGAILAELRLARWPYSLVLGFETMESYRDSDHYAGAVIGRHANRIAHGHVQLTGSVLTLTRNGGEHHLHGGPTGTARQDWQVAEVTPSSITFGLLSPDGHEGYPGNCAMTARYSVTGDATLRLEFEAKVDRETVVNLCHHPYFDFSGQGDVAGHRLKIAAEKYLPARQDLVPTGEIADVANTPYDFRTERTIGHDRPTPGFNNTYCLAPSRRDRPAFAACLSLPDGPAMEVWTTQTGLHLYDGYKLQPGQRGLDGRRYGPGHGLCLEAQNWPDSPNRAHFPSAILTPGQTYNQVTEYRFSPSP